MFSMDSERPLRFESLQTGGHGPPLPQENCKTCSSWASVFCCLNNVDISYAAKLFHFVLEYKLLSLVSCSKCSVSLMRLPVTGVRSGDPFQRGGDRCVCTALAPEHLLSQQHTLQGRHCFPPPPSLHLQHVVCRLLGTRTSGMNTFLQSVPIYPVSISPHLFLPAAVAHREF